MFWIGNDKFFQKTVTGISKARQRDISGKTSCPPFYDPWYQRWETPHPLTQLSPGTDSNPLKGVNQSKLFTCIPPGGHLKVLQPSKRLLRSLASPFESQIRPCIAIVNTTSGVFIWILQTHNFAEALNVMQLNSPPAPPVPPASPSFGRETRQIAPAVSFTLLAQLNPFTLAEEETPRRNILKTSGVSFLSASM